MYICIYIRLNQEAFGVFLISNKSFKIRNKLIKELADIVCNICSTFDTMVTNRHFPSKN